MVCAGGYDLLQGNLVHGAGAKVKQTVTANDAAVQVQCLEHDELILGEFQVTAQLLVKGVQRCGTVHFVNSVETFYTR